MKSVKFFIYIWSLVLLQSCQVNCQLGDEKKGADSRSRTSNDIDIDANGVKIERAYLIFDDGERVPENNIVDFQQPVKLVMLIDDGWTERSGKVDLGAAERIETERGTVLLDEPDLFEGKFPDGMSPADAKTIALSASIRLKQEVPRLTKFKVSTKVWDKNGKGYITCVYYLYAK